MFSQKRLRNLLILLVLTIFLVTCTLYLSREIKEQPIYRVIKAVIESETGISTDSILNPGDSPTSSDQNTLPSNPSDGSSSSAEFAVITRIIDGDTVELDSGKTVRYIGINTPETQHPQKGKECFGAEAKETNRNLVEGKTVRLEKDVSEVDRYGRLLRYVWIEDTLINESLVKDGSAYSSAYPPDIKHQEKFTVAEQFARENKKGFWGACPLSVDL